MPVDGLTNRAISLLMYAAGMRVKVLCKDVKISSVFVRNKGMRHFSDVLRMSL
ncbi:hypothetical protein G163CM_23150 [Pseudocitrobacter corydidari]|uniref:Uncharacterized protein n=1 Tax=Pseudocitrobacter corydidari TaxID=2891570 RepID=A0ABY3S645_9ENTR|nr:hypothetical protein G163CM_23150 [Pseudocitrobacter corydidari]